MLRKLLMALFLLTAIGIVSQAQTRNVGYCYGDSITTSGGAFGTAGTYTIGALLTSDRLATYAGCRIVGLRVAASVSLGRTRTFIYNYGDEGLTPIVEQRQRLYDGWNEVLFNGDGYVIDGTESLFYGFDYVETSEMVAADEGALCGYGDPGVNTDGSFYAYGNFGQGDGLYQLTGLGALCVQLVIDVSSLPRHDLDMTYLDTGFKYKQPGENIEALCSFESVGMESVATYRLGYRLDEGEAVYADFEEPLAEGRSESWQFTCPLPEDIAVGLHTLSVFVDRVEGEPLPERSKNDTLTSRFAVYRESLPRSKAYLEVYTEQTSPYVPFLNDALALLKQQMGNILTIVNVHRPGTPLAVAAAAYLHDLYAYTWPSFTLNRSYFPGEAHIAYDMNDYLAVIGSDMTAAIIGDMVAQDYYNPAFASVALNAGYDPATRQLTVTATGRLLEEARAIHGDVALTLLLAEDSVTGRQAVYNTLTQRTTHTNSYRHDHVLRTFLTPPTGTALSTDGDSYAATVTTTLSDAWRPEHLTVVALLTKAVSEATDDNVLDLDIINCADLPIASVIAAQGIEEIVAERPAAPQRSFTLGGRAARTGHKGFVVVGGKKLLRK